jgi:hypothetical protein
VLVAHVELVWPVLLGCVRHQGRQCVGEFVRECSRELNIPELVVLLLDLQQPVHFVLRDARHDHLPHRVRGNLNNEREIVHVLSDRRRVAIGPVDPRHDACELEGVEGEFHLVLRWMDLTRPGMGHANISDVPRLRNG